MRELIPDTGIGPRVTCPTECNSNDTVWACRAEQLALYIEQTRGANSLALISGDFNTLPGSPEYLAMTNRGWLDSHLAVRRMLYAVRWALDHSGMQARLNCQP